MGPTGHRSSKPRSEASRTGEMCDSAAGDAGPPKRLRAAGSEEEKPCGVHVQEEEEGRGVEVVSGTPAGMRPPGVVHRVC